MRTTTLGTQGPKVGVIGLGCMGMTFSYAEVTRPLTANLCFDLRRWA